MSNYSEDEALQYEKIIDQPVYKFYVNKKLQLIKSWLNKKSVVLDVGCGTGVYATSLSQQCKTVAGLDLSPKRIKRAISRANRLRINNIYFVVGDAAHLPFVEKTFDMVFSVNLFHHIAHKKIVKEGFLEQVRCIKMGGTILVFELNPNSLGWSKDLIPRIIRGFVYILLFPLHQKVTDNVEEDTKMINLSELLENIKETKVVFTKIGGFIPTYCPKFLFETFTLLEKNMESTPLLRRYGAHILIVGEVHR
jgi:ubiquinone/menaquinone biosynthesis C-methylase UbiE